MKRIFTKALCLVCVGALALSLAACGGKADSAASSTASSSALGSASDYDYQNFNYSDGLDEKGYWEGIRALDYVTLPEDFASVAIKRSDVEPTSEEVEEQISDLLSQARRDLRRQRHLPRRLQRLHRRQRQYCEAQRPESRLYRDPQLHQ